MAQPESKYDVELSFTVKEQDKNEPPFHESIVRWNGVNYATVVAMEALLIDTLDATTQWGQDMAEALGQGELFEQMTKGRKKNK